MDNEGSSEIKRLNKECDRDLDNERDRTPIVDPDRVPIVDSDRDPIPSPINGNRSRYWNLDPLQQREAPLTTMRPK